MRTTCRNLVLGLGAATALAAGLTLPMVRAPLERLVLGLRGRRTVEGRLREFSAARARVRNACDAAGVAYPPSFVVLLGLKQERRLEVYAGADRRSLRRIADYPILAASGGPGPKLREGDRQVPEGVYPLESLNPASHFHVALRVGYPNELDREVGRRDGRSQLGGDIMIHGGSASVGCLAMGDPAAEDLFVLAAEAGVPNVTVVLSPVDLRTRPMPAEAGENVYPEPYGAVRSELAILRR